MTAISVVMGVWNGGDALSATLDSILAQTEGDFELIVVDDGSADATPAILAEYSARDSRIVVIRQENAGLTRALIAGCSVANGRYIARHDAGDFSDPRRFALQKEMLDAASGVVFVSSSTRYVGPEMEPLYVLRSTGRALEPRFIIDLADPGTLIDGPTHHGSVMFRRDAYERVGGYRAAFRYAQDFDLWFRLAEVGTFQSVDEVLYTARLSPASISGAARAAQQRLAALARAALEARRHGESDAAVLAEAAAVGTVRASGARSRASELYFVGEVLRRNGDARSRRYLRRSIAAFPLSPRAWLRYLQSLLL